MAASAPSESLLPLSGDSTTNYILLALPLTIPLIILSLYPSEVLRWFQRKRYQYEVTYALYMLTPTEKFVFNSILFLFLSLVTIAAVLYLPSSISNLLRRAWYYLHGDLPDSYPRSFREMLEHGYSMAGDSLFKGASSTPLASRSMVQEASEVFSETMRQVSESVSSEIVFLGIATVFGYQYVWCISMLYSGTRSRTMAPTGIKGAVEAVIRMVWLIAMSNLISMCGLVPR